MCSFTFRLNCSIKLLRINMLAKVVLCDELDQLHVLCISCHILHILKILLVVFDIDNVAYQ